MRRIWKPELCHGIGNSKFEGWYYKLVDQSRKAAIAIIPGFSSANPRHAFIQIFNGITGEYKYHTFNLNDFRYTRNELSDEQYIENLTYSPYSLSAKAYIPMLGIHISKKIKNALVIEGFLCGGPMFVECHYQSDWSYEWRIKGNNYNWLAFNSAGVHEEKGTGTVPSIFNVRRVCCADESPHHLIGYGVKRVAHHFQHYRVKLLVHRKSPL